MNLPLSLNKKMKPLQKIYRIFVLLGVCPPAKRISLWMKLFNVSVSIICPILLLISLISSAVFCLKYFSIDLVNAICAIYPVSGLATGLFSLFRVHIKRRDIKKIYDDFQTFYDTSKNYFIFLIFFFLLKTIFIIC